ncbi:MAG: hypothetical protein M3176_02900 [Chloroflexota bacterium]|nr:hypothetical protein [Chloroflexota bacterium]MDQ6905754.1 hypothetical protein [Chloroflexota bacterium]
MTRNPTQLVQEYVARDPATLREAQRRLTLEVGPTRFLDRLVCVVRRPDARGYGAIRNERVVYTSAHLGALRRALVQWAAQHAPAEVGGFRALLAWALAWVDWPEVVRGVTIPADECAGASVRASHVAGFRRHTAAFEFDSIAR